MWLTTPDTMQSILIERQLEPRSEDTFDPSVRGSRGQGTKQISPEALRDMPIVSIGQPEHWRVQDLYAPQKLPRSIRSKLNQDDFHLVRFTCTFRPVTDESRVKWARFRVNLCPNSSTGPYPLAFDLYPQQVVQEVRRSIKVTFSPLLKFQELEASVGRAEFGFEYTEQVPLISGTLGTSFDPTWSYDAGRKRRVEGTKEMYLLIKAPKGLANAQAQLELDADVLVRGTVIAARLWRKQEQAADPLTVSLWG